MFFMYLCVLWCVIAFILMLILSCKDSFKKMKLINMYNVNMALFKGRSFLLMIVLKNIFYFRCGNSFFFFWPCHQHVGSFFPNQVSKPWPLHWNPRILTTGLPGKFLGIFFFFFNFLLKCSWFTMLYQFLQQKDPSYTHRHPFLKYSSPL